jgi:phage shock protein C
MKRLYKSRKHKVLDGICGGIAEYFDVDPVLIRIIAILFFITGPAAFIAYIVGMIIVPYPPLEEFNKDNKGPIETPSSSGQTPSNDFNAFLSGQPRHNTGKLILGVILLVFGIIFLMPNIPFFGHGIWWLWSIGWKFLAPSILIIIGLLIILSHTRK